MNLPFFKYQGTGNDFVLIDQRAVQYLKRDQAEIIRTICDRRFGIGADGLILLQNIDGFDFEMIYFNADGGESTMCGNGGRCITAFAKKLGIIESKCTFLAIDGPHEALAQQDGTVNLKMTDVTDIEIGDDYFILNTGSPHYVIIVEDISDLNVVESGQVIRYSDRFREAGINVNFVEKIKNGIEVATYERGVEDETLSCGTGVTAAAIAWHLHNSTSASGEVSVQTKGGNLKVKFEKENGGFKQIWLCGPTKNVFSGNFPISNF